MVGNAGIEPAASSMSTKRSTTELIARIGQGGNRTPEGECQLIYSQPRLTASVPAQNILLFEKPKSGFEPLTYSLPWSCSTS